MSNIEFNCPKCGQPLAVEATAAGATVTCPKCGQPILVPQLARAAAKTKWWMVAAGVVVVALLAAGVLIWQTHRRPAIHIVSAPPVASPESPDAKAKETWVQALNVALGDLQTNNDQESVKLVSGILASLDQPGGLAPDALAGDVQHLKDRVQELVRQGALDSAVALNLVQCKIGANADIISPSHPNHKTGGNPGPGGLVLYLPLDKPADNGIVHDESGAGNDGQVFGAQWVPDGKFGGAYHFSLTNFDDRIVVPNSERPCENSFID